MKKIFLLVGILFLTAPFVGNAKQSKLTEKSFIQRFFEYVTKMFESDSNKQIVSVSLQDQIAQLKRENDALYRENSDVSLSAHDAVVKVLNAVDQVAHLEKQQELLTILRSALNNVKNKVIESAELQQVAEDIYNKYIVLSNNH